MSKFFIAMGIALASLLGLACCGSTCETVGNVGGAALGGAVGSSVSGGSTLGTIGGAAVGGYIGHEAGQRYEERNRK
jgi:osmotically inducible lipoprotein OsmB